MPQVAFHLFHSDPEQIKLKQKVGEIKKRQHKNAGLLFKSAPMAMLLVLLSATIGEVLWHAFIEHIQISIALTFGRLDSNIVMLS